jgi:fused signal recognition particle receptor
MRWMSDYYVVLGAVAVVACLVTVGYFWLRRRGANRAVGAGAAPVPAEPPRPPALQDSLTRTRQGLLARLRDAWGADKDTESRLLELEEALLAADVGPKATRQLLAKLRPLARQLTDVDALRGALRTEMRSILENGALSNGVASPYVILVAGVNGVGKTTTIGKLAYRYRQRGRKVLLVAADTFRAAAGEQLEHWAERVGAVCIRHQSGSDPSAVAFDGLKAAVARGINVVIVDTAGRLHVKTHLMEELKKVVRVIGRQIEGAPHEILLVIDATTGQNALSQARVFCQALAVTGIVLTKLDGTAKGGAVFAVRSELGVPIRYVGLGERPEDLTPFNPATFVDALLAGR